MSANETLALLIGINVVSGLALVAAWTAIVGLRERMDELGFRHGELSNELDCYRRGLRDRLFEMSQSIDRIERARQPQTPRAPRVSRKKQAPEVVDAEDAAVLAMRRASSSSSKAGGEL